MLTIAKSQLGDTSRVTEIVKLNTDQYPKLSLKEPLLEEGWTIYLPSRDWLRSSGNLEGIRGTLTGLDNNSLTIRVNDINNYLHLQTVSSQGELSYKSGDCVRAIFDGTNANLVTLTIESSNSSTPSSINSSEENLFSNNLPFKDYCLKYGFSNKEEFLRKYVVKKGDTLTSITESEMGSASRVKELIALNQQMYPEFWDYSSFVEVGFTLYLPPTYIKKSNGAYLDEVNGEIAEIGQNGQWTVKLAKGGISIFTPDQDTIYLDKKDFSVGDCVKIIWQRMDSKVFSISS